MSNVNEGIRMGNNEFTKIVSLYFPKLKLAGTSALLLVLCGSSVKMASEVWNVTTQSIYKNKKKYLESEVKYKELRKVMEEA